MEPRECDICIVGAGAAGIWAAERAAREGVDVILVEKTPRVGTKILASGGQKCNLTTTRDVRGAEELYGEEGGRWLRHALYTLPPRAVRDRFHELGVPTKTASLEKVFPVSERAVDVRDALEQAAREAEVEIWLESPVEHFEPEDNEEGEAGWRVDIAGGNGDGDGEGRAIWCRRLLLCPGGKSYPGAGTTGDGYRWLERLGLEVVEPVPDLVGLVSPADWVQELAGVDIQNVEARMVDGDGRILARRRRPVVFTHGGISGPGAMDLAEYVTRPLAEHPADPVDRAVSLDLYPDHSRKELRQMLIDAASEPGARGVWSVLPEGPPTSVFRMACRLVGLQGKGLMVSKLPAKKRNKLVEHLKGLPVPVVGSDGFDHAEVTAGGLALDEVDPQTMAVQKHPGLYIFGELLNVTGPIGGLNFLAAWAEAEVAAHAAVEALR